MHYSLSGLAQPNPKGQVSYWYPHHGLWPQRRRTTRSLIAHTHDERTKMHDSSESFNT